MKSSASASCPNASVRNYFFNDVQVPKTNVRCEPGKGFIYLMEGLAEERLLRAELDIAQTYVDQCVRAFNAGALTAIDAAKAKLIPVNCR